MKKLVLALCVMMAPAALANTQVIEQDIQPEFRKLWSSFCLYNIEREEDITINLTFGEGETQEVVVRANTSLIVRHAFADGGRPMTVAVEYDTDLNTDTDGMTMVLPEGNITRWRQTNCEIPADYKWVANPDRSNDLDLIEF